MNELTFFSILEIAIAVIFIIFDTWVEWQKYECSQDFSFFYEKV